MVWCLWLCWVVELYADYGGVNVVQACLNLGGVYGIGVCVNVLWCSLCCYMLFVSYVLVKNNFESENMNLEIEIDM